MEHPPGPLLQLPPEPAAAEVRGSRIGAVLRLVRAENCVMAGCATLVGAGSPSFALTGPVTAVMLVLAFGNVVNDVTDRESDRLGKAHRPLPSGRMSTPQASWLAAALLAGALGVTSVFSRNQLPFVLAMGALAALYTPFLKSVPLLGNAVFAGQCGATLVFGAQAGGGGVPRPTIAAAVLVAVGILCVEVAKTVEDDRADRAVGVRTVAHLVATEHQPALVGAFATAYALVWALLLASARNPALFALAAAPAVPLLAFAVLPPGAGPPSARVPRFIVASKCLWPLALVALIGL